MRFTLFPTPEILFGCDGLRELPKLIKRFGTRALLITGGSSLQSAAYYQSLISEIEKIGIKLQIESLKGEPSTDFVDSVTSRYRDNDIRCIVAIGGGSPIDAGKAISAMLPVNGSVQDYLEGVGHKTHPGLKVPFIAVSTSSGTGSEATFNAVISQIGPNGYKKSLRHSNLMPNIALVDPMLTLSCPPPITASSGMDAFTQLLEAYVSTVATPMTDALLMDALKYFPNALETAFLEGDNIEARSQMAYASLISGLGLANAGLGVVHGFASPIGGYFSIPHGVVCGTLLAPSVKLTINRLLDRKDNLLAIRKYASVGKLFATTQSQSDEYYCMELIDSLYDLSERLKLPRLGDYGIASSDVNRIVAETGNKNNPAKLYPDDMVEILEERM